MAVPVIILGAAGIAALTGVGNGANAVYKNAKANRITKQAQTDYEQAKLVAEIARDNSRKNLEKLGQAKLNALNTTVDRFVKDFGKIHNIELKESIGLNEVRNLAISQQAMLEVQELGNMAAAVAKGIVGAAGTGALLAAGAYGAVATFGVTATTGTAIASLSGVAATNATLAFLGGGAIAAGGGGMALGTLVLGGVAAGPAAAVLGIVMNASASKKLDTAYSNKFQADEIIAGLNVITSLCNAISARTEMFQKLLAQLSALLDFHSEKIENIIENSGSDYNEYSEEEQNEIAMALSTAGALKQLLDTPILNEDGSLTSESEQQATRLQFYIEEATRKRKAEEEAARKREAEKAAKIAGPQTERGELLRTKAKKIWWNNNWSTHKNATFRSLALAKITNWEVKDREVICFFDMSITQDGAKSKGLFITETGLYGNFSGTMKIKYEDISQLKLYKKTGFLDSDTLEIMTQSGERHRIAWEPFKLKRYLDYAISLPPLPSEEEGLPDGPDALDILEEELNDELFLL